MNKDIDSIKSSMNKQNKIIEGYRIDISDQVRLTQNDFRDRVEAVDSFHKENLENLLAAFEQVRRMAVENIASKENELKEQVEVQVSNM